MELSRPLTTVTPTLDGDVLAVLARQDDITFTTGQLHRILHRHSEEGIRKVLQRLTRQGVVLSTRVGSAYAYQFNRDHLAAPYIRGLAGLLEELLARLEKRFESWITPPVYAAVFGSAAHGSMRADSDLDLLLVRPVDADEDLWRRQVDEMVATVSREIGNDIRPVEFSEAEIAANSDEPVLRDVADKGLTVAGTRAWLTRQLRGGT